MPDSPEPLTAAPATGVAPDILCRACGYELKGIAMSAACPECGAPVATSLRGDILEAASPEYVRTLWRGVLLAELVVPLLVLSWTVLIPLAIYLAERAKEAGSVSGVSVQRNIDVLQGVLSFVVSVVSLAGWWMLTRPDPGYAPGAKDLRGRRLLRGLLIVRAVQSVLGLCVVSVPAILQSPFSVFSGSIQIHSNNGANTFNNPTWILAIALRLSFFGLWLLQFLMQCRFLGVLAARIPSTRIAKHSRRATWLIPLCWTVGFAACFTGPPAALIYYWWILDLTRRSLGKIIRLQTVPVVAASDAPNPLDSAP